MSKAKSEEVLAQGAKASESREQFAQDNLKDAHGASWCARDYQRASLESRALRKVHCDGRDVGKTSEIVIAAAWASVTQPNSEMLIATQCENHLFPLMNRLARLFQTDPLFSPSLEEIRRSPSWYLRFKNGFVLWGRIAGPRGINFQGMHADWIIVDEAQEMTEEAWGELYQALNGGGRQWIYGVPNGLRNTFYRMTQMKDWEQYNWASALNPEFTPEKDAELARLYGGKNAPGYQHRVLGLHGAPAHGVFNLDDYLTCVQEVEDFENVILCGGARFRLSQTPPPGLYILGCDLGYARDPSEFVVYRVEEPYLKNVLRVHLEGVNYARQQDIIAQLDEAYHFMGIGIDSGNNGRAVAHQLISLGGSWPTKVEAYDFGSNTEVGMLPGGDIERRATKRFMTELIERRLAEHTLVFPPLADRESQYASHTYTLGMNGRIVYDKGDDHIIDADRCALLRHFRATSLTLHAPRALLQPCVSVFELWGELR